MYIRLLGEVKELEEAFLEHLQQCVLSEALDVAICALLIVDCIVKKEEEHPEQLTMF